MTIEAGDYVTIGDNALVWEVFSEDGYSATLRSGQTMRRRTDLVKNLRLFKKGGN